MKKKYETTMRMVMMPVARKWMMRMVMIGGTSVGLASPCFSLSITSLADVLSLQIKQIQELHSMIHILGSPWYLDQSDLWQKRGG